jgi:hypothetical protein
MHKSILFSSDAADGGTPPAPPAPPAPDSLEDLAKRLAALEAQVNPKWAAEKTK